MKDGSWIPVGMAAGKVVIDASMRFARRTPDCQRERPRELLTGRLRTIDAGLGTGMSPAEIREFEAARAQALIANQAELLWNYGGKERAIAYLRALADKLESR